MNDNELLINTVVIAKLISEEIGENKSYENIVRIADELKLTPYQVTQFIQLYKKAQQYMLL